MSVRLLVSLSCSGGGGGSEFERMENEEVALTSSRSFKHECAASMFDEMIGKLTFVKKKRG